MTNPAEWLLHESGLTGAQLGRAMGVGVRTFLGWAAGTPVPGHHRERLAALHALIEGLAEDDPAGRRQAVLSGKDGRSLFQEFLDGRSRSVVIHPAASGREQLGI